MKKAILVSVIISIFISNLISCSNTNVNNKKENNTSSTNAEKTDNISTAQSQEKTSTVPIIGSEGTTSVESTVITTNKYSDETTTHTSEIATTICTTIAPTITTTTASLTISDFFYTLPEISDLKGIVSQANKNKLKNYTSYRSDDGSAEDAWDAHIYIAPNSYSDYNGNSYKFNCDYIDIFVERSDKNEPFILSKAHYYINQSFYNVEYSAKGNLAGNHIQVCKGMYAVDPTATFSSLEEALEKAYSLTNQ